MMNLNGPVSIIDGWNMNPQGALVPTVVEKSMEGERSFDLYSRLMRDRIIFVHGPVETAMADIIVGQLLLLEAEDPHKDITMYINSPGGEVMAGLAIANTMNYIKCDVRTVSMGMSASMGAFLLSAGSKGKRFALENAEIMIHQPSGGASGVASDIDIAAKRILRLKEKLNHILALNTSQPYSKIKKDTERDYFMDANEALDYGIIDKVIKKAA